MYSKTIDMDNIRIIRYNKTLKRGHGYNHEYEKKLHEKKMQLLEQELKK